MDIIATYLAKEFLKRKLIKEDALEWCIYGIGKRLSTLITGVLLIVSGSYHLVSFKRYLLLLALLH